MVTLLFWAHKEMKKSGTQGLTTERGAANAKLAEMQLAMRDLKIQLNETEKASRRPTKPGKSIKMEDEHVEIERFKLDGTLYVRESAKLLAYLEELHTSMVSRAKGITDRHGTGWSAYERLEQLLSAAQNRVSDGIEAVLRLDPEIARSVRLDAQGFPNLDDIGVGGKS